MMTRSNRWIFFIALFILGGVAGYGTTETQCFWDGKIKCFEVISDFWYYIRWTLSTILGILSILAAIFSVIMIIKGVDIKNKIGGVILCHTSIFIIRRRLLFGEDRRSKMGKLFIL